MDYLKRVGILGGSFNPIHLGHLILAEEARKRLRLDKVIFIPAYLPPHKAPKTLISSYQRYRMVAMAVKDNPYFEVSDIELNRKGLSYSIETVQELKTVFGHARLYFIVGSDFLKEFTMWKEIGLLSRICRFAIAKRPGWPLKKLPKNMQVLKTTAVDISSTDIRKRIRMGESIRYLVPEKLRKYISTRKLYCS